MYCNQCGTPNPDENVVCTNCGQPLQADPAQFDEAKDAQDNKTMAILAYILFFIPLITGDAKKSPFVKFHTNQGTVLWIACIALNVVLTILSFILALVGVGIIASLLSYAVSACVLVFAILGIIAANKGEKKELPLIGKFKILK